MPGARSVGITTDSRIGGSSAWIGVLLSGRCRLGAGDFLVRCGGLLLGGEAGFRGGLRLGVCLCLGVLLAGLFGCGVIVAGAADALHAFLEAAQTLTHALAQFGELLTAKQQYCYPKN